jgi:hypothetical protein
MATIKKKKKKKKAMSKRKIALKCNVECKDVNVEANRIAAPCAVA